jgi:hypothetical protein
VAGYIQWTTLKLTDKVYKHTPEMVINDNGTTLMGELLVFTVRTVQANRPDVVKGKGKAVPLQAWSGPEGSRKLSFPDFLTTAQDGGKVVSLTHQPHLSPGNIPGTHFC